MMNHLLAISVGWTLAGAVMSIGVLVVLLAWMHDWKQTHSTHS